MFVGTQTTSNLNAASSTDMDLIMRLHQFAYNPSVHKANPYVDVTKLNLGPYLQDMFGQDVFSQTENEMANPLPSSPGLSCKLDETPDRLDTSPLAPITPMPMGDISLPALDLGLSKGGLQSQAKNAAATLQFGCIPTPPSTCLSSPLGAFGRVSDLTDGDLQFLTAFAHEDPLAIDEHLRISTGSYAQERSEEERYTELPCPSSDFSPDVISSPIDVQPPFHGLPTPEDENDFDTYSCHDAYTPAPVRNARRLSASSTASEDMQETIINVRKRKAIETERNGEKESHPATPVSPAPKRIRHRAERHPQPKADRKERTKKNPKRSLLHKSKSFDLTASGSEWSQSSIIDYPSSSLSDYSRSSPGPFDDLSSPAPSVYDSDSEFTNTLPASTYLNTPMTGSKAAKANTKSPARHFVSPSNIFGSRAQSSAE